MTDVNPRTRPLRIPTPNEAPPTHPPRGARRPVPTPRSRRGADRQEPEARGTNPLRLAVLGGLVVLAGLGGGWPLLLMIAALVVMISLHELGHYLTAKWAGMKVTEFFIGFGPRIWSFQRGETEYGIKAIPAGAYVKIIGMNNLDEFDPADADRTYMSKPFWRRLSVAVAGSTMHFLLAGICFFVAFAAVGLPGGMVPFSEADVDALEARSPWVVVETVSDDSAASEAGVEVGDRIFSVDGVDVATFDDFGAAVRPRAGETVPVVLERDGVRQTIDVAIGDRDGQGFFGVSSSFSVTDLPNERSGVVEAVGDTGDAYLQTIGQTFGGLADIFSPSGIADLGRRAFSPDEDQGPVVAGGDSGDPGRSSSDGDERQAAGIIRISDIGAGLLDDGQFGYWLAVFATINIFIGIFNLVPLLPLDGGHVAIAVYEKIQAMRKGVQHYHVDVVRLLPVTWAVVVVLAFLTVSIVVLDTRTIVGG